MSTTLTEGVGLLWVEEGGPLVQLSMGTQSIKAQLPLFSRSWHVSAIGFLTICTLEAKALSCPLPLIFPSLGASSTLLTLPPYLFLMQRPPSEPAPPRPTLAGPKATWGAVKH